MGGGKEIVKVEIERIIYTSSFRLKLEMYVTMLSESRLPFTTSSTSSMRGI